MAKHRKKSATSYPKDEDWVNFSVDIHDGWADDVSLVYPEGSWRPDDGELTTLSISDHPQEDTTPGKKDCPAEDISKTNSAQSSGTDASKQTSGKKTHYFRTFMILWLGTLSIVIAMALGYFYDFLDSYERTYQASRPYHMMDDILISFQNMDMDTIYKMQTVLPSITEFETEENVKSYMTTLLDGKTISYEKTTYYNEDFPEYKILADGYVIATVALRKSQTDHLEYDFPVWYVSSFEFYTQPLEEFRIQVPETYTVYINGVELTEDYFVSRTLPEENRFVETYASIPYVNNYYGCNLYEVPVITAVNSSGTEYMVLPEETTGDYIIPFPTDCPEAEEMKEFAINAVTTYANYISNDTPDNALDPFFPSGSEMLRLIKANTSRKYYMSHHTPEIQNIEVRDFIIYSDDIFYCEVYLEQSMKLSWGGEPEIVPTDGHFYFVRIDGEWKVSSIAY